MEHNKYMIIKPDNFSGKEDVKQFIKQYEKAGLINGWSDDDKIKYLSIFLKETAATFLENLENKKNNWTWDELKNKFLFGFQPIGYTILLKSKLENKKQGDLESITSFITDVEGLCRQVDKNMKEEDICTYILKGIREPILQAISLHDNSDLCKLKDNLRKYELMQFRINSRGADYNEITDILNKQVMQIDNYSKEEIKELKTKLEYRDKFYNSEIERLNNKIKNINILNKREVNFRDNSRNREERGRSREIQPNKYDRKRNVSENSENSREISSDRSNYYNNRDFRDKSPYPGKGKDSERSSNRPYNRERSYSRERESYNNRSRENNRNRSYDRNYRNNSYTRDNNYRNRSYSRERKEYEQLNNIENSREKTPERYRDNNYEKESIRKIICYKCNEKGHYADRCSLSKN